MSVATLALYALPLALPLVVTCVMIYHHRRARVKIPPPTPPPCPNTIAYLQLVDDLRQAEELPTDAQDKYFITMQTRHVS